MKEVRAAVKDSPIPIYYQIYVDLKERVLSKWGKTEERKLPSEQELAEEYQVSRVCMRQALAELEKDGLIMRYRGRGTFVKDVPKPLLCSLGLPASMKDNSVRTYIDPAPEIVELSCFDTTYQHISEKLNYQGRVFYLKRIMKVDGNPIALNKVWIPEKYTPNLDKTGLCIEGSLSKTLRELYHLTLARRENVVEASRATSTEVKLLKITYDTLIMKITSVDYNEQDVPFAYSMTSWNGDAIRLRMDAVDIEHKLQFAGNTI